MSEAIQDPLNIHLPEEFQSGKRQILVAPLRRSTFRLMHDPHDPDRDRWFDQNNMPRVTDGNEVKHLIRGQETYEDMAQCMRATLRSDQNRHGKAFIYLAGWDLNGGAYDMPLVGSDLTSKLKELFKSATAAGVDIRVMVWANYCLTPFETPGTIWAVDAVNQLPTGRAIIDWKTAIWWTPPKPASDRLFHNGTHHQKIVLTRAFGSLLAFVGGIDIDPKRLDGPVNPDRIGWQDVHCRIRGPAADDVLATFSQRWDDYLDVANRDANHDTHKPKFSIIDQEKRNGLSAVPRSGIVDAQPYRQSVQICRTFASKVYDRIPPGNQAGEKTIRQMVRHAIGRAQQFIYMEDQYLFSMEISEELKKAIARPTFRWLIMLMPGDGAVNGELAGQASHRRAQFILNLKTAAGGEKVMIFEHKKRYVHSKIYIIDDKFAIIGSANCNRRGMQHDSEIAAGIFDKSSNREEALHFARRLRIRLWATHLNLAKNGETDPNSPVNSQAEFAEMADGVACAVHWAKLPPGARVLPYKESDDLQLAIQGLAKTKAEMKDKVMKYATGAMAVLVDAALDIAMAKFTSNKQGVDNAWNELYDPGDP